MTARPATLRQGLMDVLTRQMEPGTPLVRHDLPGPTKFLQRDDSFLLYRFRAALFKFSEFADSFHAE
jgi:hypothetical protein